MITTNRRRFLQSAALGAAGLGLLGAQDKVVAAAAPRGFAGFKGVQLAIATICTDGFGNHHHEPAFRVIPGLGLQNVEFNVWYPDTITPAYVRSLKERCAGAGLRPISHGWPATSR
ncbi:MAG: hypothetical protein HC834_04175 [Rhodospirillales bacterium]|nr:hypothetical protein [Rhodospirillales bacterium]